MMGRGLRAGAAAVTITPPLGVDLAGDYGAHGAGAITSDLSARALVLEDGDGEAAILTLDICYLDPPVARRVVGRVEGLTGIPAARVLLTCTHTHAGPATDTTPWFAPDPPYLDVLIRRAADAVVLARQRRREARLLVGHGYEDTLAFNRRYWMRDGTLRTNPGLQNPDIVRPAGPTDPGVGLLRVEDLTGRPIALLVNFALHVAVVGDTISADYPGTLARILQAVEGDDVVVLFSTGCCGDVNHLDVSKPGPQSGQAMAERIGTVLAGEVLKVSTQLTPLDLTSGLHVEHRVVELAFRMPTAEELATALERYPFIMRSMDAAGMEAVAAHRMWWIHQQGRATDLAEIQVLTIDDLAYVTLPAEPFVALGLAIKERSPFPHTFISMLNGSLYDYYLPTEKAYAEGGYEATNSAVVPGSGERIVAAALEALTATRTNAERAAQPD